MFALSIRHPFKPLISRFARSLFQNMVRGFWIFLVKDQIKVKVIVHRREIEIFSLLLGPTKSSDYLS